MTHKTLVRRHLVGRHLMATCARPVTHNLLVSSHKLWVKEPWLKSHGFWMSCKLQALTCSLAPHHTGWCNARIVATISFDSKVSSDLLEQCSKHASVSLVRSTAKCPFKQAEELSRPKNSCVSSPMTHRPESFSLSFQHAQVDSINLIPERFASGQWVPHVYHCVLTLGTHYRMCSASRRGLFEFNYN